MKRLRPYLVLSILWGLYFHPLILHPTHVLYSDFSDFLAEHLPAKLFLNHEYRETGAMPLWNPYHFCGTPLVHDIQVGCYYPPYAVMYLVPEAALGAALSWVIALHVLAAGVFAFVYARSHNLGEVGSLVAAVGFMLSAKWMTHLLLAGHTITIGLAWLPLVLLGLERTIRSGGVWPTIGAGIAYALLLLGTHPQWAFYSGVFVAAWTFPAKRTRRDLVRWLSCGCCVVAVVALLCAVQLLPTYEASRYSTRAVGLESTQSLQAGVYSFFGLIGPSASNSPPNSWEARAVFGAFWLIAAFAAPLLAGGRARWWFAVFAGLLVFSFGGSLLIEWLPGFRLFRAPSRMLLVAVFPLAFLAGIATDSLLASSWDAAGRHELRRIARGVAMFGALPSLAFLAATAQQNPGPIWSTFVASWVVVALGVPLLAWITIPHGGSPMLRTACWVGLLLAELLAPSLAFPEVREQSAIYPESRLVKYFGEQAKPGQARSMDIDMGSGPQDRLAALGYGSPQSLVHRLETPRGYNPLDVRFYREFVNFIIDRDEQVLSLSPVAQPVIPNFEIVNPRLFDLLNLRLMACEATLSVDAGLWLKVGEVSGLPPVPALPPNPPEQLPTHAVYLYRTPMPRAVVVPEAARMPAGSELAALKACDFRRTVLISTDDPIAANGTAPARLASVVEYRPDRVTIDLAGGGGGFLVLGDVWFPGWTCRVDDVEVPIHRANHAFRAVAVPDGAKQAVFAFEPRSFRIGWWVSAVSLVMLAFALILRAAGFIPAVFRKRPG